MICTAIKVSSRTGASTPIAYRELSYIDVLRNRVPASAVAGKRILVGATAIELGDRYATPRYGLTPGVVIQAIATESLLQNRAIQRSGPAPTIAAIVLVAFLLGAARYRTVFSYFSVAAPVVTVLAAGPLVAQWLWPISINSAAALATACACIAVRSGLELRRRSRLRALFDVESGLPNRLMLEKALLEDEQGSAVIIAASVDRFEIIRDTIGVSAAGEMILGTAERIRPMISGEIFRVAPDTIAWLEPEFDQDVFTARAKEFSALLRQPVASTQGAIDVSLRIGIDAEQTGKDPKARIDNALVAIGEARASGALFESFKGADLDLRRRLSMMSDLRQGMEDGQVELFYQPKLSLHDNRISDAEALVRWNHPRDGQISPDDFIPLAEETGVIRELTNFALRRAMRDCVCWRAEGKTIRIAVNVSANDIAAPDFAALVEGMLRELGVAPDCLTLEVTESAIIRSPTTAISVLSDLRSQGIRLSIDDYGTGQSSLSYLKQLPIHELKIDRSFVTNICQNAADAIMVRSTIDLAHQLGLEVVAEGVEDRDTLEELRRLNCDYAQGFGIARPKTFQSFDFNL